MKTAFCFLISVERAAAFTKELINLHAALPQPASGGKRVLNVYSFDTDHGEQRSCDLEYYDRQEKLVFGYYLTIDADGATVNYTGEAEDFGYGDVGPYMGMHQEIKPEQRTTLDGFACMRLTLDRNKALLSQVTSALTEVNAIFDKMMESHFVIRDTDGTGATNYGHMSLYELDGIQFVSRPDDVEYLCGAKVVPCAKIPEFNAELTLRIVVNVHYKEVWIYILKKEDIRALAAKLSVERRLTVNAHARILAIWKCGQLETGPYPLSHFYANITPEQEEKVRF